MIRRLFTEVTRTSSIGESRDRVNCQKQDLSVLHMLKNLRELAVVYNDRDAEKFDDLLTDHSRLTKLEIYTDDIQPLGM